MTTGTPTPTGPQDRFEARKDRSGRWRVVDTKTGRLHSAAIKDRARAQAQAATLSRKYDAMASRYLTQATTSALLSPAEDIGREVERTGSGRDPFRAQRFPRS